MSEKLDELNGTLRGQFSKLTKEDFSYVDPRLSTSWGSEVSELYAAIIPDNEIFKYRDQTMAALAEYKMGAILAKSLAEEYKGTHGIDSEEYLKANFYYNTQVELFYNTADIYLRKHGVKDVAAATKTALDTGFDELDIEMASADLRDRQKVALRKILQEFEQDRPQNVLTSGTETITDKYKEMPLPQ